MSLPIVRPNDTEHDFVRAVSTIAAMEGATDLAGHSALLPYLGMARAELTDFGQRRVTRYLAVGVTDLHTAAINLEQLLTAMLSSTTVEQHRLRIEAALRYLRSGQPAYSAEVCSHMAVCVAADDLPG